MKKITKTAKKEENLLNDNILFLEKERISKFYEPNRIVSFFNNNCSVRVANNPSIRKYVYEFIHEAYSKMGYTPNRGDNIWFSIYDAIPETTTLIAENSRGEMAGSLTIVFDSSIGLPADELYSEEVSNLRKKRDKICEIVSFATHEDVRGSVMFLAGLLYCVYLLARKERGTTDLIITVNDRQENFYCQSLLFEKIGYLKTYDKVNGAPAVLLRLDWEMIDRLKKNRRIFPLSMFNYSDTEESDIIQTLKDMMSPMSYDEFIHLFSRNENFLERISLAQREYIIHRLRENDSGQHYQSEMNNT